MHTLAPLTTLHDHRARSHRRVGVSGCVFARQAYGMHGWRCGYVAYPNHDGQDYIGEHLIR